MYDVFSHGRCTVYGTYTWYRASCPTRCVPVLLCVYVLAAGMCVVAVALQAVLICHRSCLQATMTVDKHKNTYEYDYVRTAAACTFFGFFVALLATCRDMPRAVPVN